MVLPLNDVRVFIFYSVCVSVGYFYFSKKILSSAHGLLVVAAFIYAAIISGTTEYGAADIYYWPLNLLLILAVVSVVYSIREFTQRRWVHWRI